jgi:diamine N-acetyltransferase
MPKVHLRSITPENAAECTGLQVHESQRGLVASNAKSLAEAHTNRSYYPLAIYDQAALGWEISPVPMLGFTMYELVAGVGFVKRLMIGQAHQRNGYGRAAMLEVIRRLRLHPEVEIIATSHRHENEAAAMLYCSLGFKDWKIGFAQDHPTEKFLILPG